jgi:EAL domain-containing protein (putative c-di-GMP-specific phosphodiesterase class I)
MPDQDITSPELQGSLGALGSQLLTALPGVKTLAAALFDAGGGKVWSSGELAADEEPLVHDALDAFALESGRSCVERDQQNGRTFLVLPLRCPRGQRRGAAAVVLETRTLGGSGREKLLDPALQTLLKRLSIAIAAEAGPDDATVVRPLADLLGGNGPPGAEHLTLYVQQLLKLRTSGRTRRYEVLLRSNAPGENETKAPAEVLRAADRPDSGGVLDRYVVTRLTQWLADNREHLEAEPASFSVNLSVGALMDPSFADFVGRALRETRANPRLIAFEIRESLCRERRAEVERLIDACDRLACQIVIDDFTLHSDVLPLLRHKAVRLLKIDAQLTGAAIKDKLSQAIVVGIAQMAKILGQHCVAKRIDSAIARQWLAATGVDFAQGFLLEGPLPLSELTSLAERSHGQST